MREMYGYLFYFFVKCNLCMMIPKFELGFCKRPFFKAQNLTSLVEKCDADNMEGEAGHRRRRLTKVIFFKSKLQRRIM